MSDSLGGRMSLDIRDVKAKITELNNLIRENESQWRADASQMEDWTDSQEGLEKRVQSLNKEVDLQHKKLETWIKRKEDLIDAEERDEQAIREANNEIIKYSKQLEKSQQELKRAQTSLDKLNSELGEQDTKADKAEKSLKELNDEAKDSDKSFDTATVAIGGFIANGLTAMVSAIGGAISSFAGLAESTIETRKELGLIESVADKTGASADRVIDKWVEMTAVIGDEGAVREGISNLLSAGFTAEQELNDITKALEGASIQWRDTLSFEGLSDSLQEWIGTHGESLTGNFAELLERLGYNLEEVTAQTDGMTDAQRRQYAIAILNKNGMGDLADAYRETNEELIELERANKELEIAQAGLGEIMSPMVATVKNAYADIIYSFTDMVSGVEGGKEQFIGLLTGMIDTITSNIIPGLETALTMILNSVPDLIASVQTLATSAVEDLVLNVVFLLADNVPKILNAGLELIGALVQAIFETAPKILAAVPTIIESLSNGLFQGKDSVFKSAIELLMEIVRSIPTLIGNLLKELPKIITTVIDFMLDNTPVIYEGAFDLFMEICRAIPKILSELVKALFEIVTTIVDYFKRPETVQKIKNVGKAIIEGLLNGLKSVGNMVWDSVKDVSQEIVNGFKSFFGIHSPSKLMETSVGEPIMEGVIVGIENVETKAERTAESAGESIADGLNSGIVDSVRGIGNDTGSIIEHEINSIPGSVSIEGSAQKIGETFVTEMSETIKDYRNIVSEALTSLFNGGSTDDLFDFGSSIIDIFAETSTGASIFAGFYDFITEAIKSGEFEGKEIDEIAESIATGILDSICALIDHLPEILDTALKFVVAFALALVKGIPEITKRIPTMVKMVVNVILENIPLIIEIIPELVEQILDAVAKLIPEILAIIPDLFKKIVNSLIDNAPHITDMVVEIIKMVIDVLTELTPEIVKMIPQIISEIILTLSEATPTLVGMIPEIVAEIGKAFVESTPDIIAMVPEIIKALAEAFIEGVPKMFEVGKNLIEGLWEGIKSIGDWLWDGVQTVGNWIVNGFKSVFGIHSPSKVMADEVGKFLALGIEQGLTDNLKGVNQAIKNGVDTSVELDQKVSGRKMVTVNQTNNYSQAHSRYELYKSKRDTANAVKLALQGV